MQVSRPPIQRTNTMGPTSAIQDWELERVLMLAQLQQFRERVDYVEKKAAADKEIYNQHRMSLLKQIKLKDTQLEKRIQYIEAQHETQVQLLQQQREQDKQEYHDEIEDLRSRYERLIETEQQKHQRRISGFQQRLSAKQSEYAKLAHDFYLRQTQSAPSSPTRTHHDVTSTSSTSDSEDSEEEVHELRQRLISLRKTHEQEKRAWQAQVDALIKQHKSELVMKRPSSTAEEDDNSIRKLQKAYIQGAQAFYEERVHKIEATYKLKMDAMAVKHQEELAEMKERFMHEGQEVAMHMEARIQNLVSEHTQVLAELREEHNVRTIEHQAAMDDLENVYRDSQAEAVASCEQYWQAKVADMRASMSADTTAIQAHWEARVAEATAKREAEFLRLVGEIGVIRDRLDKEITRRRDTEKLLDNARQQAETSKKMRALAAQTCQQLKREQKEVHKLAVQLVSVTDTNSITMDEEDQNQCRYNTVALSDLLTRVISNASVMQARHCIIDNNEGSASSFFGDHPLFGFLS